MKKTHTKTEMLHRNRVLVHWFEKVSPSANMKHNRHIRRPFSNAAEPGRPARLLPAGLDLQIWNRPTDLAHLPKAQAREEGQIDVQGTKLTAKHMSRGALSNCHRLGRSRGRLGELFCLFYSSARLVRAVIFPFARNATSAQRMSHAIASDSHLVPA